MVALMPAEYFQELLESGKTEIKFEHLAAYPAVDRITLSFKNGLKAVFLWGFDEIIVTLWDGEAPASWIPIEFEFPPGSGNTHIEYKFFTGKKEVIEFVEYCLNVSRAGQGTGQQEKTPPKPQQKIPPITQEDIQALKESY